MAERLGEILIRKKLLAPEQLEAGLKMQMESGKFLGEILIELGHVKETDLLQVLAEQFNTRFVSLDNVRINREVVRLVPQDIIAEHKIMPLEMRNGVLLIAVFNPLDMWPLSVLQKRMNLTEVQIVLATKNDIEQTIKKYYT